MLGTTPSGTARRINRLILTGTFGFSVLALAGLLLRPGGVDLTASGIAGMVYGASLLLCSLFSWAYNMHENSRHRWLLRYCDHSAIFLLIAGTYTPFVVGGIEGPLGLDLLVWVWGLAFTGILLKVLLKGRHERAFVVLYLALGWLFLTALHPFITLNPLPSLIFLSLGGAAYTVGALIYGSGIGNWTDPVWHGCVLAGSGTHFVAVLLLSAGPRLA